jgi:hypothetical protein
MQDPYATYDRAKLVEALKVHGPTAQVGGDPAYSNFGAAVLGEALASAWGVPYPRALAEHVLYPLGMKGTGLGIAGQPDPANLAPGHVAGRRVATWTFQAFAPAGAVRSTARDMALFAAAALGAGGTPLSGAFAATEAAQAPYADVGGHIGLGWMIVDDPDRPIIWHNGATAGSHSFIGLDKRHGSAVVILCNFQKASEKLGFGLLGSPGPKIASTAVPNASDYTGAYPLNPAFVIKVTTEGGSVFLQATGQPRIGLRPKSEDRFSVIGVAAEVSFERDASGKVVALVLHQNGLDQRGERGSLPPPPVQVSLPPETLRDYAGSYPLTPSFVITITVEDGALFAQATGQAKFPVFASAKDEFYYTIVDAQISFSRDAVGKVSGLVLHQGGQNIPASKSSE